MKIVRLETENVKRLHAVTIAPDDNVVIIGGENGAGKSSVLDSIEMAIGGKRAAPPKPIRTGKRKARIVADLGDIVVERIFTQNGSHLTVTTADGEPQKSPQSLLDSLCSKVAFDPLAFAKMDAAKQAELARKLLGIDFAELDAKRAKAYAQRTEAKRDAKALEARIDAMPLHDGAPAEVSVSELLAELASRQDVIHTNNREREKLAAARRLVESATIRLDDGKRAVAAIEHQLTELQQQLELARGESEDLAKQLTDAEETVGRHEDVVASLKDPDTAEVQAQIETAEDTNRKARENAEYGKATGHLKKIETAIERLTAKIDTCDEEKRDTIAQADFPVDGLGFDDSGITLNGLPFEQASQAEKLRVSVAMGFALNPQLKVLLIRDGSLLGPRALKLVAEMAAKADGQVWLERVGDADPTAVVIEDGMVRDQQQEGSDDGE